MIRSAKKPVRLKKRALSNLQQRLHNFSFGSSGEGQAVKFLQNKNFQILDQNVRVKNHEIDIIALDNQHQELVFIEVKTRATSYYGDPSHAVDQKKIRSMNFVADIYLRRNQLDYDYRFDIIAITPDGVEHYQNITWS